MEEIAHAMAATFYCEADVAYQRGYPPTVNAPEQVDIALIAAREAVGDDQVIEEMPGCYVFIGNGMTGPDEFVHAPRYDFNDEITARGVAYWTEVVRAELP